MQRILRGWVEFAYLKTAVRGRKLGRKFLEAGNLGVLEVEGTSSMFNGIEGKR